MFINRRSVLGAITLPLAAISVQACGKPTSETVTAKTTSPAIYEAFDDAFYDLVDKTASFDVLGEGYGWSEGPAWDRKRSALYFTDVPGNIAYKWTTVSGVKEFLNPSGAQGLVGFREAGANGLLLGRDGKLLICNHGKRAVEAMDLETKKRTTLVSEFNGKALNSPNDLIENSQGDIYFTDPPYGLEGLDASPLKEQPHNGVYKLSRSGDITLLAAELTFPNGVVLSPDETTLYIAQSDPKALHIYSLDLTKPNAKVELLTDLTAYSSSPAQGLPDGMVVDAFGNIFATGPDGVFVLSPDGTILGRINTGKASANCTFGEDGHTLFITNYDRLIKLRVKTRGLAWA